MDNDTDINTRLLKAEDMFERPIPFKIYSVDNKRIEELKDHTHDYMQVWYVMEGYCEHRVGNILNHFVKGNIFVLPPFIVHNLDPVSGVDVRIIGCEFLSDFINENIKWDENTDTLFDFAYIEPFLVSKESVKPRLFLQGDLQLKVEQLLLDMFDEYKHERKYYEINIKANLLKLLAILAREYENSRDEEHTRLFNRYRRAVNSALGYIDKNYMNKLYIEDICRIAMMSHTHFSYIFKQITGKTFVEYVNRLRVRKAAGMIMNTQYSMTEICHRTGFNDSTYFSRVFKKEMGLSPRLFRNLQSDQ